MLVAVFGQEALASAALPWLKITLTQLGCFTFFWSVQVSDSASVTFSTH